MNKAESRDEQTKRNPSSFATSALVPVVLHVLMSFWSRGVASRGVVVLMMRVPVMVRIGLLFERTD